jgi:hypothetical protein
MEIGEKIVDSLREDAGPVDGIDGSKAVGRVEGFVGKKRFYNILRVC